MGALQPKHLQVGHVQHIPSHDHGLDNRNAASSPACRLSVSPDCAPARALAADLIKDLLHRAAHKTLYKPAKQGLNPAPQTLKPPKP